MSIPHEFRPFAPGARVIVEGVQGEGYFTGGFSLMGFAPPFQLYLQVYWIEGGPLELKDRVDFKTFDAYRQRSRCTSEKIEMVRAYTPGTMESVSKNTRFVIPGLRRIAKPKIPKFVILR